MWFNETLTRLPPLPPEVPDRIEGPEIRHPNQDDGRATVADPSEIVLREMNLNDIEMMVDWFREDPGMAESMQMPEGTNEFTVRKGLLAALKEGSGQLWGVAERDGEPVGIAALKARMVCEPHIIISPHHRYGKTFKKVFDACIEHSRVLGLGGLSAFVPEENRVVIRAAKKVGFKDQGVRMLVLAFNDDSEV